MNGIAKLFSGFLLIFFLSGCMYPDENLAQNKIPYQSQLDTVQNALNEYKTSNGGILPIRTKEATTPIYQKYLIDFKKLVPGFLPEIPGNAYESGGIFQYVLIDVEVNPTVKLLDLRMADTIRDIKLRLSANEYPPFKEQISKNVFTLDFNKLGYAEDPVAISPFTGRNLPYVITGEGEIYVDYRSDLYQELKESQHDLSPGEDIRTILIAGSMFVPAYSLPYTIDSSNREPIFLEN